MIRRLMKNKKFFSLVTSAFLLLVTLQSSVFAMAHSNDPNAPTPPAWTMWVQMAVIGAVVYFFIFRPQSRQRKERDQMLGALKKGDKIVTNAGFIVTVSTVGPKSLEVKLNDDTRVRMMRSGVAEVLPESADAELTALVAGSAK